MNDNLQKHISQRLSYFIKQKGQCRLLVISESGAPDLLDDMLENITIVYVSADIVNDLYSHESIFTKIDKMKGIFEGIYLHDGTFSKEIILSLYRKVVRTGFMFLNCKNHLNQLKGVAESVLKQQIQFLDLLGGIEVYRGSWIESRLLDRYDYIPAVLEDPNLLNSFEDLIIENPMPIKWPYLRKNSPHIWRVDSRCSDRVVGVLTTEEGAILYNLALMFVGKRVLEIGCHFGFSTAHLAKANVILDVIDPRLSDPYQHQCVNESLNSTTISEFRLWPGMSPELVKPIAVSNGEPWSMAFIDGNHDGQAPSLDALEVMKYMADDAIIVFHDLHSPYVYAGLEQCRLKGWEIMVQNTMQGLGIAYRGNIQLPYMAEDINMPAFNIPKELI